jgi:hypothetical protein
MALDDRSWPSYSLTPPQIRRSSPLAGSLSDEVPKRCLLSIQERMPLEMDSLVAEDWAIPHEIKAKGLVESILIARPIAAKVGETQERW